MRSNSRKISARFDPESMLHEIDQERKRLEMELGRLSKTSRDPRAPSSTPESSTRNCNSHDQVECWGVVFLHSTKGTLLSEPSTMLRSRFPPPSHDAHSPFSIPPQAMFSGRHSVCVDDQERNFIARDSRILLNILRQCALPLALPSEFLKGRRRRRRRKRRWGGPPRLLLL